MHVVDHFGGVAGFVDMYECLADHVSPLLVHVRLWVQATGRIFVVPELTHELPAAAMLSRVWNSTGVTVVMDLQELQWPVRGQHTTMRSAESCCVVCDCYTHCFVIPTHWCKQSGSREDTYTLCAPSSANDCFSFASAATNQCTPSPSPSLTRTIHCTCD